MFTWHVRDPFGSRAVSCVKLPAAVAFPTDDRLLQRIENSRRALPPNSIKALWRSRERDCSAGAGSLRAGHDEVPLRSGADLVLAAIDRAPARGTQWMLPQTVHIEDVYARSRVAVGQR
jgi:hypothetical protein